MVLNRGPTVSEEIAVSIAPEPPPNLALIEFRKEIKNDN